MKKSNAKIYRLYKWLGGTCGAEKIISTDIKNKLVIVNLQIDFDIVNDDLVLLVFDDVQIKWDYPENLQYKSGLLCLHMRTSKMFALSDNNLEKYCDIVSRHEHRL